MSAIFCLSINDYICGCTLRLFKMAVRDGRTLNFVFEI